MFSLSIVPQTYSVNVITIGRTAYAPVYFMHRSGRPLRFIQRIKGHGYVFVPYLDSDP